MRFALVICVNGPECKRKIDAKHALKNIVTFYLYRFDLSDRDSFFDSKTRGSIVSIKYCQMHSINVIFDH